MCKNLHIAQICAYICYINPNKQNQTEMAKFNKYALQKIKSDPDLFAAVAKEMDVKPVSLGTILERNGNSLNQYSVVKLVADYLGTEPGGLIEDEHTEPVK